MHQLWKFWTHLSKGLHWDNRNKACEHPDQAQCARQSRSKSSRSGNQDNSNYLFSVSNAEYIDDGLEGKEEYDYDYYDDTEYYNDDYEYYEDNEV